MSEQKPPIFSLAATVMAAVTCCTSDTKEQNTEVNITGSAVNRADLDAMPVIKSSSTVSQDLKPILEEKIPE